jgi:hypothetical protein
MKKLVIFIALAIAGCAVGPKITIRHDDFSGKTAKILQNVLVREKGTDLSFAQMSFWHNLPADGTVDSVFFSFGLSVERLRLYNCRKTVFLLDGERWGMTDPGYDFNEIDLVEILYYYEPMAFVEKLARANEVRMQVCGVEYEFGPAGRKKLAEFIKEK